MSPGTRPSAPSRRSCGSTRPATSCTCGSTSGSRSGSGSSRSASSSGGSSSTIPTKSTRRSRGRSRPGRAWPSPRAASGNGTTLLGVIVRELELDLDAFEGPFDLLLALVLKDELDLREIDVAGIVLAYLERLAERSWPPAAPAERSSAPPQAREAHQLDLDAAGE